MLVDSDTISTIDNPKTLLRPQVPNIRFNVGKTLERLVPLLDGAVVEQSVRASDLAFFLPLSSSFLPSPLPVPCLIG